MKYPKNKNWHQQVTYCKTSVPKIKESHGSLTKDQHATNIGSNICS
jgi:hypothetical protein